MTDTSIAKTRPQLLISILLDLLAFGFAWYGILRSDFPPNLGWVVLGVALVLGMSAFGRIGWALFFAYVLLLGFVIPDHVGEDLILGPCLFVGVVIPLIVLWKRWKGWKGPKIDLGHLDDRDVIHVGRSRLIVGLHGYAGAGKDTAALGLLEQGWTRVSFADVLRNFCYAQNPWVRREDPAFIGGYEYLKLRELVDEVGWHRAKVENEDVRELLQHTGTEAGREVLGEDVWVQAAMANLPDRVVVTDVRFPNEAQAIKDAGGIVVKITRPGVGPVNGHLSDRALEDWPFDAVLGNDFTAGVIQRKLRNAVDALLGA